MIIIEKNEGAKIPYSVSDTKVCFDDELTLKLSKLQKDEPVHKDICYDPEGDLIIGVEGGRYYVAEIDIPAIEYEEVPVETEDSDNQMGESVNLVPKPLDMDKVTLTLWSTEDKTKIEEVTE